MIDLILLAGGASRRFGGKKLTALFHGRPLYTYAFDAASAVKDLCRVTVVTNEEALRTTAREMGFSVVNAPPPDEGIAASIRTGVAATDAQRAVCLMVCDQPHFTGELLRAFLLGFLESGKLLGRVYSGTTPGNPAVFAAEFRTELLRLTGDSGGKQIFLGREHEIYRFSVSKEALLDYDTPWGKES